MLTIIKALIVAAGLLLLDAATSDWRVGICMSPALAGYAYLSWIVLRQED